MGKVGRRGACGAVARSPAERYTEEMLFFVIVVLMVVALITAIRVVIEAFKTDLLWGLGCLLIPGVFIAFAIVHWGNEEARKAFIANVVVTILIPVVGFVGSVGSATRSSPRFATGPRGPAAGAPALPPAELDEAAQREVDTRAAEIVRERRERERAAREGAAEAAPTPRPKRAEDPLVAAVRQLYAAAGSDDPAARLEAVRGWRERRLNQLPEGYLDMVRALAGRESGPEVDEVVASVREHPPAVRQTVRCLEVAGAPPAIRQALLERLRDAELDRADADLVVETLERLVDTADLMMEEVLFRHGRLRTGAARRLVAARGVEWGRSAAGRALLGAIVGEDVGQARPLLEEGAPDERVLTCELLGGIRGRAGRAALKLLLPVLRDEVPAARAAAANAMAALRDESASWGLARALLHERDREVRAALQRSLVALPTAATLDLLERLHREPRAADRLAAQHAARALDREPRALLLIATGVEDAERIVRLDALKGLLQRVSDPAAREVVAQRQAPIRALAGDASDPEVQQLAFKLDRALLLGR